MTYFRAGSLARSICSRTQAPSPSRSSLARCAGLMRPSKRAVSRWSAGTGGRPRRVAGMASCIGTLQQASQIRDLFFNLCGSQCHALSLRRARVNGFCVCAAPGHDTPFGRPRCLGQPNFIDRFTLSTERRNFAFDGAHGSSLLDDAIVMRTVDFHSEAGALAVVLPHRHLAIALVFLNVDHGADVFDGAAAVVRHLGRAGKHAEADPVANGQQFGVAGFGLAGDGDFVSHLLRPGWCVDGINVRQKSTGHNKYLYGRNVKMITPLRPAAAYVRDNKTGEAHLVPIQVADIK